MERDIEKSFLLALKANAEGLKQNIKEKKENSDMSLRLSKDVYKPEQIKPELSDEEQFYLDHPYAKRNIHYDFGLELNIPSNFIRFVIYKIRKEEPFKRYVDRIPSDYDIYSGKEQIQRTYLK